MSSSKKLPVNGTLRKVFIRVYRLEIANFLRTFNHVGIFDPALWSVLSPVAPLPFSLAQLSPLPCVKKYLVRIQCVIVGGGRGMGLETIFCRSFTLCIWPDSEPTKLLENPKPRRGGGLRQINTCRKVSLQVNFLDEDTLHCLLWVLSFHRPNPRFRGEMKTTTTDKKKELERIWRNVDIRHSPEEF